MIWGVPEAVCVVAFCEIKVYDKGFSKGLEGLNANGA